MGGWCKERYNKDENNKLEGLHQKRDQMEETRWEGQNFSEVVAPQEEVVQRELREATFVRVKLSVLCILARVGKYRRFGYNCVCETSLTL